MANSVIGALRVSLGIDSAQFQTGLKNAKSRLDNFGAAAVKAFAAVGSAGAAMGGALAVGIKRSIDEFDKMSKAAQKFGTTTEELARLGHAADLSGVSMETLGKGMQRLSRNMIDAEMGLKAPQRAFDALGIAFKNADGTMKTSSQIMSEVADRFSRMEDGAKKTGLAMTLFGRAGGELIPMFNAGAAGLQAMKDEADALGIVMDTNTARAAENFNDNLTRMTRVKDGLIMKITAQLLPALENLSEQFLGFARNEELVQAAVAGIGSAIQWIARQIGQASIFVSRLRIEIGGLLEAMSRLNNYDFSGAMSAWNEGQEASAKMRDDMNAMIDEMFSGMATSQAGIQRRISDAHGEIGAAAGEQFVAQFEEAVSGKGGGRARAAIDTMAREAARIFDQTRTPLENYQAQIARLNELLAAGAINQDTYNRAVMQAQDAFSQAEEAGKKAQGTFSGIGDSIASTFANAFQGLIDGSKKAKDVLNDLLKQLSSMALNSAFKALFGGLFGGGGGGGLLASIFGGFRAAGGPVSAGRAYVVGERGPELMVPGSSGTVIPNHALGEGASQTVVRVELSPDLEARILKRSGKQSVQIVQAAAPGLVGSSVSATGQALRNQPAFGR